MTVNILKSTSKSTSKSAVKSKVVQSYKHKDQIQQMYQLQQEIEPLLKKLKPLQKSLDLVKADLQKYCDEMYDDSQKATIQAGNVLCEVGAKGQTTKVIDKERAIEILQHLGDTVVLELIKFGITDLRKYLTPDELEEVTETNRSGKRIIKLSDV